MTMFMLTLSQKKILKLLAINSWYSNKDIAKSIGISEDAVHYQINKLINEEKYAYFINNFHFKELGFDHHHYLIRFKDISEIPLEELTQIPEIFFMNTSSGEYDLQIIFCHRNDKEFINAKKKIDGLLHGKIANSIVLKFYVQYKFTNFIPEYDIPLRLPKNQKNPLYKLDSEDWHNTRIVPAPVAEFTRGEIETIKMLLKNPRATYTEIGRKTNQSYETIRQQVRKFVEKKYLGNFGIFPNFNTFGYYANYVLLNIESIDDKKFMHYVQNNNKIFYTAKLIGKYDIILYFVSKHPDELNDEIRKLRNFFPNQIIDIEMLSFDKIHKSVQFPEVLLSE